MTQVTKQNFKTSQFSFDDVLGVYKFQINKDFHFHVAVDINIFRSTFVLPLSNAKHRIDAE